MHSGCLAACWRRRGSLGDLVRRSESGETLGILTATSNAEFAS